MEYIGIISVYRMNWGGVIPRNTENQPHNSKFDADSAAIVTGVPKSLEIGSFFSKGFQSLINFDQVFTPSERAKLSRTRCAVNDRKRRKG